MKNKPFIIVVTGRPGSGKTTLAHRLARKVHCPALCRDELKEGFVHTLGGSHYSLGNDVNKQLYDTFFETVQFLSSRNISLVIEAAFQHHLWQPKLLPLLKIAHIIIIICSVDPQLARSRMLNRSLTDSTRERFHGDRELFEPDIPNAPLKEYKPPNLDVPTLIVDTTDGYAPDIDDILSFIYNEISLINR